MEALGGSIVWEIAECIVHSRNSLELETAFAGTFGDLE